MALLTIILSLLAVASPSFATNTYTVKSGDTLSQIAQDLNLTIQDLTDANPQITNVNEIYPGQTLTIQGGQSHISSVPNQTISTEDRDLLARLVHAEAGGEPYAGQVEVAEVVLNRVKSDQFPNTISGVIDQPGQFQSVSNGAINQPADETNFKAVDEALQSTTNDGALYFYNPALSTSDNCSWFETLPTVTIIGDHIFKK